MPKRSQGESSAYTAGYSLVVRTVEGKAVRFRRINTLDGHVQFDLEHPDPSWAPAYLAWLARQVLARLETEHSTDTLHDDNEAHEGR